MTLALKITYFINQYPKVSHSFIRREILALERRGFEVQRIALRGQDEPLPDSEDNLERSRTRYVLQRGLWGLLLPTVAVLLRSPARLFAAVRLAVSMARDSDRPMPYHLVYVAEACVVVRWARAFGARRIHAHFGTNSAEIVMLARVLGGPAYSFTVHGPDEFLRPMGLAEKIRRAAFVVAISSFGRSQLYYRSHHTDWEKIRVVRCGIDSQFYDVPPAESADCESRRLICVGRLCEAKGQLLLLEAAARLREREIPFELVLAGDGPLRAELEKLVETHQLTGHVRITGWLSSLQVRAEILAARALVLPSFAEGLPVVIMEAMALRRPVLTTYVAGIPELVRHGEHGWLMAAGSVEELVDAMECCLSTSADDLRRLGDAAYDRVIASHSVDAEVAKLAEMFTAPA